MSSSLDVILNTLSLVMSPTYRPYDDVIKWKHFPRHWPFMWSPVNSPRKDQWHGALMLSLICVWTNVWISNRAAGDVRRHRAHFDVSVMHLTRHLRTGPTQSSFHFNKVELHIEGYGWLTHWGRVTHICVNKQTIISSDNGLSPGRRQAIIWTNVGILLIGPWGTNFSEILIGIQTFSFKKMHLKMSSAKWRPFCLGLNVLIICIVLYGK